MVGKRWVVALVALATLVGAAAPAGSEPPHFESSAANIPGWAYPLVGDFDGDGADHDIYWWAEGVATDRLWRADGDRTWTKTTVNFGGDHRGAWFWPVVGHFDAGPTADIFWYSFGPEPDFVWYGKEAGGFSSRALQVRAYGYLPIVGDFDGNHVDDVLWYSGGTRRDAIWFGNPGGTFRRTSLAVWGEYIFAFTGDVNGDGRSDLLWWNFERTKHSLWMAKADGSFAKRPLTGPFDAFPILADFDGDGRSDIFWTGFFGGAGALALAANGIANLQPMVTPPFSIAFTGNFDGDNARRDDIVWPSFFSVGEEIWLGNGTGFTEEPLAPPSLFGYADPVIGQFDDSATNNASDIVWFGFSTLPDRFDWGIDVDGPPPAVATSSSGPGRRLPPPPNRLPDPIRDAIEQHATR